MAILDGDYSNNDKNSGAAVVASIMSMVLIVGVVVVAFAYSVHLIVDKPKEDCSHIHRGASYFVKNNSFYIGTRLHVDKGISINEFNKDMKEYGLTCANLEFMEDDK